MSVPRIIVGGLGLVIIAFAVAIAGWWFFIRDEASLATNSPEITDDLRTRVATAAASTAPATGATATSGTPAGTGGALAFTIIPDQSEAGYFAGEKLASIGLPSTAHGTTKDVAGTFYLTSDGFGLDASQPSTFTVGVSSLKSDEDRRDNRVRDTLQVSQFPSATFIATSVTGIDSAVPADQEHTFQLTGLLNVHGVQKEVTWEVKARRDGNLMTGLATVTFRYDDFGMSPPNIANFVAVEDDVTIQVQVVAQAAS